MTDSVNDSPRAAAATAHPEATRAAMTMIDAGGNAVDAAIAAQAVIAVLMPDAAGLGGDLLALIRDPDGRVHAVNGTGLSPAIAPEAWTTDGAAAVTVPGLVDGWTTASSRWGWLGLQDVLRPAILAATEGTASAAVIEARDNHRARLERYGASAWSLMTQAVDGPWRQPELAHLLERIGVAGRAAFYDGPAADAIERASHRHGGTLAAIDLLNHRTDLRAPITVSWANGSLHVQPPASQGVLLAMIAAQLESTSTWDSGDHLLIETTGAAFESRDSVIEEGIGLLDRPLIVDPDRAQRRHGARSYLHTAGVAVADRNGWVVSSLVSVFDDFGSGVFVPELGLVLNNRAAGFTAGANRPRASAKPVHTLAPAMLIDELGDPLAIATPGGDGQVQTLAQVLCAYRRGGRDLQDVLADPRWRSEDGRLLIENGHPATESLRERGHDVTVRAFADPVFGAVVAAGARAGRPWAASDPRRATATDVR